MNALRTIVYMAVFGVGSIGYVIGSLVVGRFSVQARISVPRAWAKFHYWCVKHFLGITVHINGTLPQSGVIVAIKHESMLEAIETLRLFDRPAVVFKAELLGIPLWGRVALAHGVIPVEREAGAAALRTMLRAARAAVADDRPILIFPEGTRIAHGQKAPLRPGIAGLYKSLALPIVPIAVDSGRVWPRNSWVKRPGVVRFVVGDTIPVGLSRDVVEGRVHEAINALNG